MASTEPRRGEVWLVALGAGRDGEPAKHRPAIVVSADELNANAGRDDLVVVVPLSSSRAPSALRPEIPSGVGVERPSRAICRAVRSIPRTRLLQRTGELPPGLLADVDRALALVLALDATPRS